MKAGSVLDCLLDCFKEMVKKGTLNKLLLDNEQHPLYGQQGKQRSSLVEDSFNSAVGWNRGFCTNSNHTVQELITVLGHYFALSQS